MDQGLLEARVEYLASIEQRYGATAMTSKKVAKGSDTLFIEDKVAKVSRIRY